MSETLRQAPITCRGHTRPVVDLCFSSQTDCGSLFVSAAKDGKAIFHRGDTGDWIGTFIGHHGAIWSCVLDAHATKAATGSADFTAKIWDTGTGQMLLSVTEDHIVRCVDLSKSDSGARLLTANNSKRFSVYDLMIPDKPLTFLNVHGQFIRRISWCDCDRRVLTASEDGTLKLWDLASHTKDPVLCAPFDSRIFNVPITDFQFRDRFSDQSTGSSIVSIAAGTTVSVLTIDWRDLSSCLNPGNITNKLVLPCLINSVSMHPTEDVLVCGGKDHYVYHMNFVTGDILATCKGHFGPVHCARFSPDGHVFASASEDGTVRLWQTEVGEEFGLWRMSEFSSPIQGTIDAVTNHAPSPTELQPNTVAVAHASV